jgi:hypothetical protein
VSPFYSTLKYKGLLTQFVLHSRYCHKLVKPLTGIARQFCLKNYYGAFLKTGLPPGTFAIYQPLPGSHHCAPADQNYTAQNGYRIKNKLQTPTFSRANTQGHTAFAYRHNESNMKQPLFKDPTLQYKFDRDGYVVFDFITEKEATAIARIFYDTHPQIPEGFYADAYSDDEALKARIFNYTDSIMHPAIEHFFVNYKKLGATFLCKSVGEKSRVGVHQDWTVVDETKYYSATIWIPTTPVNETNGALRVIPGSHLFFNAYRSNNIPYPYRGNEELLWNNMLTVPMQPGQAFVLNHAVIHASSPNLSHKERLVIAYGIASKNAPLFFYHREPGNISDIVEKYEMPDDFFQRYFNVGQRPTFGKLVEKINYPTPAYTADQLQQLIQAAYGKSNS